MTEEKNEFRVWEIGLDPATLAELKAQMNLSPVKVEPIPDKIMSSGEMPPHLAICGNCIAQDIVGEILQVLSLKFGPIKIYYVARDQGAFHREEYIRDNASDVFLLPFDQIRFYEAIQFLKKTQSLPEEKTYRSVKLIDIEANTKLDFNVNVFMPVNKKFVCISKAGLNIDGERLERLRDKTSTLFVDSDEMGYFYKYTSDQIKKMSNNKSVSATEKQSKIKAQVQSIIAGIFTESLKGDTSLDQGKKLLEDARGVVNSFIAGSQKGDWYLRFTQSCGDRFDYAYSHAANVSTYAALFSLGLGIGNPEDLAIAGLLHDIGMVGVPPELNELHFDRMSNDDRKMFQDHVGKSLNLIRKRKMLVPDIVYQMVEQHHEEFSGKGFPKGLRGDAIKIESQVLAVADYFDLLTSTHKDQKALPPLKAIKTIATMNEATPGDMKYNPELIRQIVSLFPIQ